MSTPSPIINTTPSTPAPEVPLSRDVLTELYSIMLRARLLAKRLRTASQTNESILAGTLPNVAQQDLIMSATRHPVLEALRGTELSSIPRKNNHSPSSADYLVIPPTEAFAGVANGLALASRRAHSDAAVVVFASGKKTRGSAFQEAADYAAANRLALVIVSDWTDSRTSSRNHDGASLSRWPFPTIAVDGRDVIAVYRVTKEAINAARRGHGPTLVDCVNFLAPGGRGRDDRDPLLAFRGYLQRHNAWSDTWDAELQSNLKRELAAGPASAKS